MKTLFGVVVVFLVSYGFVSSASAASTVEPCGEPHIQAHLAVVLSELRSANKADLTDSQRARRAQHIERLETYRESCEFPQNDLFDRRITPIFVDNDGTHCAVGHLLAMDGETDLVEEIRTTRNTANIWELAENTELQEWLLKSGLSLYEVARIQPAYCTSKADCFCSGWHSRNYGVAVGRIEQLDDFETEEYEGRMKVEEVFGGSSIEVGDFLEIMTETDDTIGRRVIASLTPSLGGPQAERNILDEVSKESARCGSYDGWNGQLEPAEIPIESYVDALLAEDCLASIGAYNSDLVQRQCSGGGGDESGCRSVSSAGAVNLAMAAIFALIAFQRRQRR